MSRPSEGRRNTALVIAILAGLIIGVFIKRVQIGLIIGIVLGLLIMGLSRRR
jgi:uncharacterized membrane protein (UPF0136 family)